MGTARTAQSLNGKLIFGFLVVAIPAVAVIAGINFYALRELNFANRDLQEISRSLDAVRALEGDVGRALIPLGETLSGASGQSDRFDRAMREVEEGLQSCGNTACHGATAQPREMAQKLAPYTRVIRDGAVSIFKANGTAEEHTRLVREINQAGEEVGLQLQRMSGALLTRVGALQERSEEVYTRVWRLIAGSIVILVPLAILIAYLTSRQLVLAQEIKAHRERLQILVTAKTSELEHAHASLMRSEKLASLGVLAAGIAHELNNPLTSVLMNVNLLIEDAEGRPDIQRELKRVSDDALRCQRIIDDLRDFSRRPAMKICTCNVNDIVRDVLSLTARQLTLQKVALNDRLSDRMPSIACDPDRIRQVLMNVLVNAIQAMSKGGTLIVGTAVQKRYVAITVSDSGCGIPNAIRTKIFDPFFTTKPEGTGLGLSIVHGIMEEHGGTVEIESPSTGAAADGNAPGTTVRLLLPINAKFTPRADEPAAGEDRAESLSPSA